MSEKLIISRIQQRRGPRETVPTPLNPAEMGLATDTNQVFVGDQDLAPFGIRAFTPQVSIATVNTQLTDRTVACVFVADLSAGQANLLIAHFAEQLALDVAAHPGARFWNPINQIQWDGARVLFVGLRAAEIVAAADLDPQWLSDPAAAVSDILAAYPGGFPVGTQRVNAAVLEFQSDSVTGEPDWITQVNDVRILNFNNFDMDRPAGRACSRVVNLGTSASDQPRMLLNELENIELAVIDIFQEQPPPSADVVIENQLVDLIPASTGGEFVVGNIEFDAEQSDVLFADYSMAGAGFSAAGTVCVLILDQSVLVKDLRSGSAIPADPVLGALPQEVTVSAQFNSASNRVQLIYRNSVPSDIELRLIARRWKQR